MPHRPRIAIALTIGLAAILAPILASIYLAFHLSLNAEKAQGLTYAHLSMRRLEETANQFAAGLRTLRKANTTPCSPQDLDVLRQIDLSSSYIQATGRASGDTLLCDSLGLPTPVSLGKPSLVSVHGVNEYYNVKVWPEQLHPLDAFSANGFVIFVDPALPIDVPTAGSDVELADFVPSAPAKGRLASIGQNFPSNWFNPIPAGAEQSFIDDGYLVTSVRSAHWDLAVITAIPEHYIFQLVRHFALILTPIGVICGIILAWVVNYINRIRSSFPSMVRRAVKKRAFFVEYQPVVDLQTRHIVGAEALVRWRSPFSDLDPAQFIPEAEECGLIELITDQVLRSVTRDLPHILEIDPRFEVSINLSATDLRSGRTIHNLDYLLTATGAHPYNIGVEATERAFLSDPHTAQLIGGLRLMGFRVAIDDFGTGYSSLACLQSLALDTLKIDRAFVDTIDASGSTSQIILHIIDMARSLRLQMVAEGIKTEAQARFLADHDVHFGQGDYFGEPMLIDRLLFRIKHQSEVTGVDSPQSSRDLPPTESTQT